jgi:hypothetical protein
VRVTLSVMLPNSRLAPMPAKPRALPNWVEGTLQQHSSTNSSDPGCYRHVSIFTVLDTTLQCSTLLQITACT